MQIFKLILTIIIAAAAIKNLAAPLQKKKKSIKP